MDTSITGNGIVLAVDDTATNLHVIEETLKGQYKVYTAISGDYAFRMMTKIRPDLILLDINMPGMDGYQFINKLHMTPALEDIPVIFLTAAEDEASEAKAFDYGAVDFIKKPIVPRLLQARAAIHLQLSLYSRELEKMVFDRTRQLQDTQDGVLGLLATVSSYRDQETGAHVKRTTEYVRVMVEVLQKLEKPESSYYVSATAGDRIIKSAKLHDIGKVSIPDAILLKPGKLTAEEFAEMKKHTNNGADMIDDAVKDLKNESFLTMAREIVIAHHEKWNGSGYPYGLKGEEIPLSARLMAIADVYDALISRRPYKDPFPHEKALEIIYKDAGTHFDKYILDAAGEDINRFDEIAQRIQDNFD